MPTNPTKSDALAEPITFEFDGQPYTIPAATQWPLETLEAFEEGRIVATVKSLLGDEQWTTFRSPGRIVSDLGSFFEAIQEAAGVPS